MITLITNSKENTITIKLTGIEGPIQLVSLTTEESFLGVIPKAELIVKCDKMPTSLLEHVTLTISNNTGYSIEAPMYVYALKFQNNTASIKLMSYSPEFIRSIHSSKFTNIKNAVNSLAPVPIDSNTDTNLLDDIPIHQIKKTDYQFLTRLLKCYKVDTIYSFNLNKIKLNDLKAFKSVDSKFELRGDTEITSVPERSDPKLYNTEVEYIDYSSGDDPNHTYLSIDKYYYPINNEYKEVGFNYLHNLRFDTCRVTFNIKMKQLLPLEVTDGVTLNQHSISNNNYMIIENQFISARNIRLTYDSVEVDYAVKSIEKI